MLRKKLLNLIVQAVVSVRCGHPTRVAIDGIDAAGKTTLANELAAALAKREYRVIRASIDGFHRPEKERYRRGKISPEGYYYDSFDNEAIKKHLLHPLGPGGTGEYRTSIFDFRKDSPAISPVMHAPDHAVLLFDGVFLIRPELKDHWDLRIFVHIDFNVSLQRALNRDLPLYGSSEIIVERYKNRYIPGQMIYLRQSEPQRLAHILIDNNDPQNPLMLRPGTGSTS
jgi:uridine kinase